MCTISMIGDGWRDQFPQRYPNVYPSYPNITITDVEKVSRAEFESLKKEMQELRELLLAAKKFDEATGQPDCEADEKVKLIQAVAKMVGVDMSDVFKADAP